MISKVLHQLMLVMVAQTLYSTRLTGLSRQHGMADQQQLLWQTLQCIRRVLQDQLVVLAVLHLLLDPMLLQLLSQFDQRTWTISMTFINLILVSVTNFNIFVDSEFPTVDGQYSVSIYLNAMRKCWDTFDQKYKQRYGKDTKVPKYNDFSYFCFHTPYSKMVQKSFFTLLQHDIK